VKQKYNNSILGTEQTKVIATGAETSKKNSSNQNVQSGTYMKYASSCAECYFFSISL